MKSNLIILCAAALLSTAAMANETESSEKKGTFASLDADGDGKLSREEASTHAGLASNFTAIDGNSDGFITEREYRRNTMPKKDSSGRN